MSAVLLAITIAIDFTIDLRSVGGYTGQGYGSISISSDGWFQASPNGKFTPSPSAPRRPLTAVELAALQRAVATAMRQPWPATNDSPQDDGCCGRIKWTMRLQQRGGDDRTFVTTWYDGQEPYLPPDLAALRKLTVDLLTRANEARRRGGER